MIRSVWRKYSILHGILLLEMLNIRERDKEVQVNEITRICHALNASLQAHHFRGHSSCLRRLAQSQAPSPKRAPWQSCFLTRLQMSWPCLAHFLVSLLCLAHLQISPDAPLTPVQIPDVLLAPAQSLDVLPVPTSSPIISLALAKQPPSFLLVVSSSPAGHHQSSS